MNILFIGYSNHFSNAIKQCLRNKINFIVVEQVSSISKNKLDFIKLEEQRVSYGHQEWLTIQKHVKYVSYDSVLNFDLFLQVLKDNNFFPTVCLNSSDSFELLALEQKINSYFNCITYFSEQTKHFFTYKSVQEKLCIELDIPVPDRKGNAVCIKRDFKHNLTLDRAIPKFRKESSDYNTKDGEFAQEWLDIDYIFNCDFYIDSKGDWYFTGLAKLMCEYSVPYFAFEPYFPTSEEQEEIVSIARKLKTKLDIRKRLICIQIVKSKNHNQLMYLETNGRVNSEFNWVRNHERSSYNPFNLLIFEKSLPNAYLYDKILLCNLFWNSYKDRVNDRFMSNYKFEFDFSINQSATEQHLTKGVFYITKV